MDAPIRMVSGREESEAADERRKPDLLAKAAHGGPGGDSASQQPWSAARVRVK